MRICPKCKSEYPDDKKFCKDCRVQLISAPGVVPKLPSNSMDANTKSPLSITEVKIKHPELENKINSGNRKKTNKIIILISILLVCIIVGYLTINKSLSKKPITDSESAQIENTGTGKINQEVYPNTLGEWKGKFGEKQISLIIEQNNDGLVSGYDILNGKKRSVLGKMTKMGSSLKFVLNEPGDDKWDGIFNFIISNNKLEGTWNSNNGRLTRSYILNKDISKTYNSAETVNSTSVNKSEHSPEIASDAAKMNSSSVSVKTCLMEWHNALGRFDYDNYIKYYAQSVRYFNKVVDLNYIVKEKSLFFKSGAWQKISNDISNIRIESISDNTQITYFNYDCEFVKNTGRVFSVNVDKMIVWSKIDGSWKIIEERDVKLNNNRSH